MMTSKERTLIPSCFSDTFVILQKKKSFYCHTEMKITKNPVTLNCIMRYA